MRRPRSGTNGRVILLILMLGLGLGLVMRYRSASDTGPAPDTAPPASPPVSDGPPTPNVHVALHLDEPLAVDRTTVWTIAFQAAWDRVADSLGLEGGINYNRAVDDVMASGLLRRVLAQTEISFSNSLIEAWWRVLKHSWLFLNQLDSAACVRKLVAFYVEEHNSRLPHSAFQGQTPDEMYFGTGDEVPDRLAAGKQNARRRRLDANRAARCGVCA